jgi:hypothetical protein
MLIQGLNGQTEGLIIEYARMAKIHGRLIVDMQGDNTVHMVFLASFGRVNESQFIVKNLNAAEVLLRTCGLTQDQVASLRAEVTLNKITGVDVSLDEEIAARFRYTFPAK